MKQPIATPPLKMISLDLEKLKVKRKIFNINLFSIIWFEKSQKEKIVRKKYKKIFCYYQENFFFQNMREK